jgi:hypothetical protein
VQHTALQRTEGGSPLRHATCLPGSFRPSGPQNTLHSFDAQMMLNFTFIPVSLTSRDINSKLMRRPWMIMDDHCHLLLLAQLATFPVCH